MNDLSSLILLGSGTLTILIYGLYNSKLSQCFLLSRDITNLGLLFTIPSFYLLSKYQDAFYIIETILFLFAIILSYFISERSLTSDTWTLWSLILLGFHGLLTCSDLLSIYLFLELQALGLYILITLPTSSTISTESGLKYFITGEIASAIFLLGCVCLYAATGQTYLEAIITEVENNNLFTLGYTLLILALIIKLGLVPFHSWIPDVYQGTSTPITTFLSTLPKLVLFLLILKFILTLTSQWQSFFLIIALLSVALGSWAGLNQTKIKRLLAYSTISHAGLIIFCIALTNIETIRAILIYLIIYIINSIQTFAILLSSQNKRTFQYFSFIGQYLSLAFTQPWIAFCLIIGFLSLAGIPPLAGFWAKWSAYSNIILHINIILITFLILLSVIAAYYYLRLIRQAYFSLPVFFPTSLVQTINGLAVPEVILAITLAISTLGLILLIGEPSLLHLSINAVALSTL